ncbi:hypothetical protein B0H19DRAFT_1316294 [Mycena capillaripes]|nr:hypothetical protein B0H19DRAFT_1316294 [Mycena capillaripes]
MLSVVVPHRERWEYLSLCLSRAYPAIKGSMPVLRHLDLTFFEGNVVLTSHNVPLLRAVVLNHVAASSTILPWRQLTSMTLLRVEPRDCVPILQQTSNLVHCRLKLWTNGSIVDHPGPDIVLAFLESLFLTCSFGGIVKGFLNTFILPDLRALEIPGRFIEMNPIGSLESFISKSGCKLQEVRITGQSDKSYRDAFPSIPKFSFA